MTDVWDEFYSSDNIPQRLKKKLSIADMRDLAVPLEKQIQYRDKVIDRLRGERDEARAEAQQAGRLLRTAASDVDKLHKQLDEARAEVAEAEWEDV